MPTGIPGVGEQFESASVRLRSLAAGRRTRGSGRAHLAALGEHECSIRRTTSRHRPLPASSCHPPPRSTVPDVYVTPFPSAASTHVVSRDGGTEPRWAHSGRELFYRGGSELMAVDVAPGTTFVAGTPRPLFSLTGYRSARNRQQYDVAPGDRRFLMIREPSDAGP